MDEIDLFVRRWSQAEQDGDTSTLERLLSDDFIGIGPWGFALDRQAWIGRHRSGDMKYERFAFGDASVRTYGDVAVVTGRHTAQATYQGNPTPSELRATLVVVMDGVARRLALAHMSFIAGSPGAPAIPAMAGQGPA